MNLEDWISSARLNEYRVAANYESNAVIRLYKWNAAVSAAFFELISHVEVTLRNAIDKVLQPLEVVESARVKTQTGWWFASPTFLRNQDLDFYQAACRHLGNKVESATRDKIFASMTFGIWDAIFGPAYEQLFRSHLVYAFPHRGKGFKRESVQKNVFGVTDAT